MSATDSKAPVPPSAVLDRPNRLLVMAPRGDDVDRATALLTSAGLAHQDHLLNESDDTTAWLSQSEVGGLEQVQHWMQNHPGGHLLCLVPEPITEIATALSQGVAPAEALQAWSARVDEALAMIRALGRRRSSVLLADDLQAQPKALLKGLGERLQLTLVYRPSTGAAGMGGGLTDDAADEARIRRAGVQYEPRAIFRMMAENALWQAPSMRMRATELLALAVPVADGLKVPLKERTWHFVSNYVTDILTASEQEIIDAMKLTWARMKIVMEPSCAVPLATILKNPEVFRGKRVGVIVTGGNVDLDKLPWMA